MKKLFICAHFELPEDFEGKYSDALKLFAEYWESKGDDEKVDNTQYEYSSDDVSANKYFSNLYHEFLEARKEKKRFAGVFSLIKDKDSKWVNLDGSELDIR